MALTLDVRDVSFAYGAENVVLAGCSFQAQSGEIVAILGPSGCGKTTLLNLVAGLLVPQGGSISLFGSKKKIANGCIGYVFQSPSLVPWLTVTENCLFGARIANCLDEKMSGEAQRLLMRYGLGNHSGVFPSSLSGGMQQRVSLIRAVLPDTKVLLLDEAFSGSDYRLQAELERDVCDLVSERKLIALLVTHDLNQAVRLADRIVILTQSPARIQATWTIDLPRVERLGHSLEIASRLLPFVNRIRMEFSA